MLLCVLFFFLLLFRLSLFALVVKLKSDYLYTCTNRLSVSLANTIILKAESWKNVPVFALSV